MRKMLVILLTLAVCVPEAVLAQSSETVTVDVTNVDIVVTDDGGHRVRGLTGQEFEIFDGKQKREITNFADLTSEQQSRPGARILILFDQASLSLATRRRAVDAARRFVAAHVRPVDKVLVAAGARSVTPRLSWSSDPEAIRRALDAIENEALTASSEFDRRRQQESLRRLVTTAMDDERAGTPSRITFNDLVVSARSYAAAAMRETSQSIAAFAAALTWFPSGPGRKVMVLIGEGLTLRPGSEIFDYLRTIQQEAETGRVAPSIASTARNASPFAEAAAFDLTKSVQALAGKAYERGVGIYPLAPIGGGSLSAEARSASEAPDSSVAFAAAVSSMSGYQLLARETGALSMIGRPAEDALKEIAADLSSYYSLGYRGAPPRDPASFVVRSKSGYKVRAMLSGNFASAEQAVRERVVAHHIESIESNDLGIDLQAGAIVAEGAQKRVPLRILIPIRNLRLQPQGGEIVGGFTVYISTGDAKGTAAEASAQTQQIRWPAAALQQIGDRAMTFAVDVLVTPPRDQISVGVLDQFSQRSGFDVLRIGG